MSTFRIFAPVPTDGPSGPFGIQRVASMSWYVPSDVQGANLKIRGANRSWLAGSGTSVVGMNFALYASDGADKPTGASLGDRTITLPGNGTVNATTNIGPVNRGSDGKVVVLYDLNDPVVMNTIINYGFYVSGTLVVDPPPALTGGVNGATFWFELEFDTNKDLYQVFGDSIANAYSVGYELSSWNLFAAQFDAAVCIEAMVTVGDYERFANNVGIPFLYDEITPNARAHAIGQLGTNDLSYANLVTMQQKATACVALWKSLGYADVSLWTIPPQQGYPGTEAIRLAFNAWLRANYISLGVRCIYDAAASQANGGLASNGDPAVMAAAFDSGDGTHPNAAGQVQIKNGWIAALAASQPSTGATGFTSAIWPAMVYPPFPRVQNVQALTTTAPVPSSRNGGTAAPPVAPPMVVPAPLSVGRVSFAPAATIRPNLTVVSPTVTQKQINTLFRIVDLRLNNQAN